VLQPRTRSEGLHLIKEALREPSDIGSFLVRDIQFTGANLLGLPPTAVPIRDSLEITLYCHGMVCLLMLLMCPRGSCPRVIGLAEDDSWFRSTDTRRLGLSVSPLLGSLCQNPLEIAMTFSIRRFRMRACTTLQCRNFNTPESAWGHERRGSHVCFRGQSGHGHTSARRDVPEGDQLPIVGSARTRPMSRLLPLLTTRSQLAQTGHEFLCRGTERSAS
jgi:hypothetical protein